MAKELDEAIMHRDGHAKELKGYQDEWHKLNQERDTLTKRISKLTGVPDGSPFDDEGCAFTYSDWMRVRQLVVDENALLKQRIAELEAKIPKESSHFETSSAQES